MQHYNIDDGTGSYSIIDDPQNELISITAGWYGLSRGYYVQVSKRDVCVVHFGTTKRSALRYARRAWKKEWRETVVVENNYPRRIECL